MACKCSRSTRLRRRIGLGSVAPGQTELNPRSLQADRRAVAGCAPHRALSSVAPLSTEPLSLARAEACSRCSPSSGAAPPDPPLEVRRSRPPRVRVELPQQNCARPRPKPDDGPSRRDALPTRPRFKTPQPHGRKRSFSATSASVFRLFHGLGHLLLEIVDVVDVDVVELVVRWARRSAGPRCRRRRASCLCAASWRASLQLVRDHVRSARRARRRPRRRALELVAEGVPLNCIATDAPGERCRARREAPVALARILPCPFAECSWPRPLISPAPRSSTVWSR